MSKIIVLICSTILFLSLACNLFNATSITGSGNVVAQLEEISGFDSVDISHSFDVEISQGAEFKVVIQVDDNLVDHLNVVKRGSTLMIGLEPLQNFDLQNVTLKAEVTMPELVGLNLSGASRAQISGFSSAKDFKVGLSGSSYLSGDIVTGDAALDLSGSSYLTLTGSGGDLRVGASGSSEINLADFPVNNAIIDISGSSSVIVNTDGRLDANASGASDVRYLGSPNLGEINTSGGSSVERK